jgi:hypothetical protein
MMLPDPDVSVLLFLISYFCLSLKLLIFKFCFTLRPLGSQVKFQKLALLREYFSNTNILRIAGWYDNPSYSVPNPHGLF